VASLDISAALPAGAVCNPHGAAVMPDGSFVLVTCESNDSVLRIDDADFGSGLTYSRAPIPVGDFPQGVAIAPSGEYAYVANYEDDTVSKIDLTTFQVVGGAIAVGDRPWGVAAGYEEDSDEIRVYVANYGEDSVTVIADSAAGGISSETISNVGGGVIGGGAIGIAVSPGGRFVYVANVIAENLAIIRASDRSVVKRIGINWRPWGVAVGSRGDYVYVTNSDRNSVTVIDAVAQAIHATYDVGSFQLGVGAPRNGDFAYVVCTDIDDTIRKIDVSQDTVTEVVSGQTSGAVALGAFIGGTPPNAPSELSGLAISGSRIDLRWTDNSSDELGFVLERRKEGDTTFLQIAELPADTTTYSDLGLAGETSYVYRLSAFNETADSDVASASAESNASDDSFSWCFIGVLLQN
jgi:YVTN family beta-propeller protein